MATRTTTFPTAPRLGRGPAAASAILLAAPLAALLAGLAAEWLDFRALRIPLLLMVGFGVLATAWAADTSPGSWRSSARAVLIGVATWAAAQSVYVLIHAARGEQFDTERFGPQWSQAIALIAAHGGFLGTPTGAAAAILLRLPHIKARLTPRHA